MCHITTSARYLPSSPAFSPSLTSVYMCAHACMYACMRACVVQTQFFYTPSPSFGPHGGSKLASYANTARCHAQRTHARTRRPGHTIKHTPARASLQPSSPPACRPGRNCLSSATYFAGPGPWPWPRTHTHTYKPRTNRRVYAHTYTHTRVANAVKNSGYII
jgi:hypothetical protein